MRRVYLDHSATTPVHPAVAEALWPFLNCRFGNPSSTHEPGRDARKAVDHARNTLAGFLGARPGEIVFTSGGTESNNLAILGAALRKQPFGGRVVTTVIEHPAVLEPVRSLAKFGLEAVFLPVDRLGRVSLSELERAVTPGTVLVSVMMANNETGIIQDIPTMAAIAHRRGSLFHTDAVQAFGKMPLDVRALKADLVSISGHKAYAPKGIGALYVRHGIKLDVIYLGGGQEEGIRPGTENVPGIVALGKVSEILAAAMEGENGRLRGLRDRLRARITAEVEGVVVNSDCETCLSNTLSMCIPGVNALDLVPALDGLGVSVSSGSACKSGATGASHVLAAMGVEEPLIHGAIRFSLGFDNTEEDIQYAADCVRDTVRRLRREASTGFRSAVSGSRQP